MKPIIKYPGAKNRIADWIISYIPNHDVYLEPFAGSLAILFNKVPCHIETVNDLSADLVNFFKVLRDDPNALTKYIESTPYSRIEYKNAFIFKENDSDIERARKFAIRCWQGFGASNIYQNGFRSGQQTRSPNPAHAWSMLPITMQQATARLKNVQIECLDALELIKRYDTSDVFIYCDPPYVKDTRKSYIYKHEMSDDQQIALLRLLKKHPGKVLISGYENDLYNTYLIGWHKETKYTMAQHGLKRKECLWMNYDLQLRLF